MSTIETLNMKNQFEFAQENEIKLVSAEACPYEFDDSNKITVRCLRILMDLPAEKVVRIAIDDSPEDYLTIMQLQELAQEQYFEVLQKSNHLFYIIDYDGVTQY